MKKKIAALFLVIILTSTVAPTIVDAKPPGIRGWWWYIKLNKYLQDEWGFS